MQRSDGKYRSMLRILLMILFLFFLIQPKRKSTRFTNNSIDNHEIEDHNEDDNEAEDEQEINDFTDFDLAYQSLDPAKMWTLESSGRIVEKIIYEYARTLKHE